MAWEILLPRMLHFIGFILWFTGLLTAGWFLVHRDREAEAALKTRLGGMAKQLALVADVGATLAIATGLFMAIKLQLFRQPWLHIKLTLVAGLLAIHALIRIRAGKASRGEGTFPRALIRLVGIVLIGIIYVAVFQPLRR